MKRIKKAAIVILFQLLIANMYSSIQVKALTYTTYIYARIQSSSTYLYSSASEDFENAIFLLPKTYFVKLISNYNEDFYRVLYRDEVGYVLKKDVSAVNETPINPFLEEITFRVFSSEGKKMFTHPTQTSEVVEEVETLSTLNYYGNIIGDEMISGRGFEWFYAKDEASGKKGYFYAGLCDNLSNIVENTEETTLNTNLYFNDDNSYLYNLINLTTELKILIIVLTISPCFILVYLLFKPFKLSKQNLKTKYKSNKGTKNITLNKIQKIIDDDL